MDKNYTITIDGLQRAPDSPDEPERISLTTIGSYSCDGGLFTIQYEESETTGFEGDLTTIAVDGSKKATVCRCGNHTSELVLEPGQKHFCHYDTGFGYCTLGILTNKVHNRLDEHGGTLSLHYSIDLNSNAVSQNELNITVRERNRNA